MAHDETLAPGDAGYYDWHQEIAQQLNHGTFIRHGSDSTVPRFLPGDSTPLDVAVWVGSVAPDNHLAEANRDLWHDAASNVWKRWNGTQWVVVGSSTFEPIHDQIWVPASVMHPAGSTAGELALNRWLVWNLPVDQWLHFAVDVPSHWNTMEFTVFLYNNSTSSGDLSMSPRLAEFDEGEAIPAQGATTGNVVFPAPAQNTSDKVTLDTDIPVDPLQTQGLLILRSSTSDTFGAVGIKVVGAYLTKSS